MTYRATITPTTQIGGPASEGPYPRTAFKIDITYHVGPLVTLINDTEIIERNLPPLPPLCRTHDEARTRADQWLSQVQ